MIDESAPPPQEPTPVPAGRGVLYEAAAVAIATVGLIQGPVWWQGSAAMTALAFTNAHLYSIVAYELVVGAVAVPLLVRRGWRPADIAGEPTPRDVLRGIGMLFVTYLLTTIATLSFVSIFPGEARLLSGATRFPGTPAGPPAIVLGSVVNAVFEEMLWLGYFVQRLAPRLGWGGAATISVALRVAVHLYQGVLAFVLVLPVAVLFTCYYVATRRVWPVVVAHMCLDAISLTLRYRGR